MGDRRQRLSELNMILNLLEEPASKTPRYSARDLAAARIDAQAYRTPLDPKNPNTGRYPGSAQAVSDSSVAGYKKKGSRAGKDGRNYSAAELAAARVQAQNFNTPLDPDNAMAGLMYPGSAQANKDSVDLYLKDKPGSGSGSGGGKSKLSDREEALIRLTKRNFHNLPLEGDYEKTPIPASDSVTAGLKPRPGEDAAKGIMDYLKENMMFEALVKKKTGIKSGEPLTDDLLKDLEKDGDIDLADPVVSQALNAADAASDTVQFLKNFSSMGIRSKKLGFKMLDSFSNILATARMMRQEPDQVGLMAPADQYVIDQTGMTVEELERTIYDMRKGTIK